MTPFDKFQAMLAQGTPVETAPQRTEKTAAQVEFENTFWADQVKQAALEENAQIQELFDWAFYDQLDKRAAEDPEFAQVLFEEDLKAAFNQGYADVA